MIVGGFMFAAWLMLAIAFGGRGRGASVVESTPVTKVGGAVLQAVEIPPRRNPKPASHGGAMFIGAMLGLALMWVLFV